MKKISTCSLVLLLLAIMFTFPGCSARNAISADTFQKEAKNSGYTVKQASSSNPNVESCYVGTTSNKDDELDYVSTSTEAAAQELYNSMKESISVGNSKPKNVDSSTYSKYVVTNGEIYSVLVRVDKTVIYAKATSSSKAMVDKFISAIKY